MTFYVQLAPFSLNKRWRREQQRSHGKIEIAERESVCVRERERETIEGKRVKERNDASASGDKAQFQHKLMRKGSLGPLLL